MALQFLKVDQIRDYLTAGWRRDLNTNADPANGRWYTNGPNNDNVGLYGGLTDQLDTALRFDKSQQKYLPQDFIAATGTVDNTDGKTPQATVTLQYSFTNGSSSTHTKTTSLDVGASYAFELSEAFVVTSAKETVTFSVNMNWSWSEETAQSESKTHTFSQAVPVNVPAGKIYKAVLTATAQQLTVPYTAYVRVSGNTETWFEDRINGHYNWSVNAGTAFSRIAQWGLAGAESSYYGASPDNPGQGVVIIQGSMKARQTVNFTAKVYDVTNQAQAVTDSTSTREVAPGEDLMPGATLVEEIPIHQPASVGA